MKTHVVAIGLVLAGSAVPLRALAQNTLETSQEEYNAEGGMMGAADESSGEAPQPPTPAPTDQPPPPANIPAPPSSDQPAPQQQVPTQTLPAGQWIYTQQYGWVYAPHEQNYTYVDPDASTAQMYIYRPTIGWGWYVSPWVISVGPRPYWGAWGPRRYVWYAHPWFHARVYAGPRYYGPRWGGPNYNVYAPRRWGPGPANVYTHHGAWGPRRRW